MTDIKLVICDLDDTLKAKEKPLSATTFKTIKALRDQGILFGIATGRSSNSVTKTLQEIGLLDMCDVIITMNGTQKHDLKLKTKEIFFPLSKQTILEVGKIFEPLDLNYCLYDVNFQYALRNDYAIERIYGNNRIKPIFSKLADIPDILYPKIMFIVPEEKIEAVKKIYAKYKLDHYRGFFSIKDLFEVIDTRVSKSYAIEQFCLQHGFSIDNVIAFGDSTNDVEMLQSAGIGVCVGNGTSDAKAVADYIAGSCEEDGVAHFLNEFLHL